MSIYLGVKELHWENWIGKRCLFPGIKDNLANLALIKLFVAFSCFSEINNFIDEASSFADTSENVLSLDFGEVRLNHVHVPCENTTHREDRRQAGT
jgi:hypothetical protein